MSKLNTKPQPQSLTPTSICSYLVLPISLPATPVFPVATHYLYLRRHRPKTPTPNDERSLFCANVPIDATEGHFRAMFTGVGGGRVESVRFEGEREATVTDVVSEEQGVKSKVGKKRKRADEDAGRWMDDRELPMVWGREVHRSGGTAVVVFVDRSSAELTLKAITRRIANKGGEGGAGVVVWGEKLAQSSEAAHKLGISRYLTHHSLTFPSSQTLQSRVDAYMAHFSHLEDLRARAQARMRNYVDEDGFTMVVRGGRNAPAKQDQAQAALERKQKEQEEKRKANTGFYRFQAREGKKEHVMRLLEKFEQDKERVKERKEKRKFKPL